MANIAGVALLLLIAFLPGLAFRRCYFTGPFSKQYAKPRLDSLLVAAFIPAVLLQLVGQFSADLFGTAAFYELLAEKLFEMKPVLNETLQQVRRPSSSAVAWQQACLITLGGVLGALSRAIVRTRKLDLRFKLFRFDNVWQYILRGELYAFPEVPPRAQLNQETAAGSGEAVEIDLLVQGPGEPMIYKGELVDYHLSEGSTIKFIILANVSRRRLSKDPEDLGKAADETTSTVEKRFYAIPGDMLVFYGEYILNINVRFVRLTLAQGEDLGAYYGDPVGLAR